MNEYRWINRMQPQTLVVATMLCYLDAVFGLLFGIVAISIILALVTIVGLAAGGFGIANEKRWGYVVAVLAASLQVVMLLVEAGFDVFGFPLLLNLVFDGALVALLVHPESRKYQNIWFK
ncbi:MAG: hypothetical protein NTU68_03815 [Actinobacteria bacterium]|jgi:hypothetical protein|nr:hypothetical protein [Actinomycetota bacterium]MSO17986.1 hypothetical protein [Acidimicrobiia bacterium]